jgi:SAM-dependent methyltransferase
MNEIAQFKQAQKEGWVSFAPLEAITTPAAARLVRHAGVERGVRLLDVGCGTGVVAITAARLGAQVSGIDLTPELLVRARENGRVAGVDIDWREADVEELPFADGEFDMVLSQFAHIFAPRPEVATREILRVLKPGGTIAFSTWPPELLVGRMMAVAANFMPPPPPGIVPPFLWGDPSVVKQRLGNAVVDIVFDRDCMRVPALSPQHFRMNLERTAGPIVKMAQQLSQTDPGRLDVFRQQFDAVVAQYFQDNIVRQDYLLTRATKL